MLGAWLGNISVCCLFGVMSGVFPKLGFEIGVTSLTFGLFMFLLGCGRSLMFLIGFRWSQWLRDWRVAGLAQLLAAGMVATVSRVSSHYWLGLVFGILGLALGTTYYRGLYTSLEGAASRGLKSGIHEAALLVGILIGSLGGGGLAQFWGLRTPYIPCASFVVLLVIAQTMLTTSARKAREKAIGC